MDLSLKISIILQSVIVIATIICIIFFINIMWEDFKEIKRGKKNE